MLKYCGVTMNSTLSKKNTSYQIQKRKKKMGKRSELMPHQRRYRNKKMVNIFSLENCKAKQQEDIVTHSFE
jgi:transcription initiation factor TFIIIB Brf1 subunit/transcription initiation factor TFIIB